MAAKFPARIFASCSGGGAGEAMGAEQQSDAAARDILGADAARERKTAAA
jgi:hypothetical protein